MSWCHSKENTPRILLTEICRESGFNTGHIMTHKTMCKFGSYLAKGFIEVNFMDGLIDPLGRIRTKNILATWLESTLPLNLRPHVKYTRKRKTKSSIIGDNKKHRHVLAGDKRIRLSIRRHDEV